LVISNAISLFHFSIFAFHYLFLNSL
jgi:hypothetical protein